MFLSTIMNVLDNAPVAGNIIDVERKGIGYVLNWVRIIGTGLALIMITYMSLRYICAGPNKRGELKKAFTEYVIGAVIFIGATNILYYLTELVTYILNDLI